MSVVTYVIIPSIYKINYHMLCHVEISFVKTAAKLLYRLETEEWFLNVKFANLSLTSCFQQCIHWNPLSNNCRSLIDKFGIATIMIMRKLPFIAIRKKLLVVENVRLIISKRILRNWEWWILIVLQIIFNFWITILLPRFRSIYWCIKKLEK